MLRKKAQIKMSFGMIFSIILIIVFIAFAFYAIKIFLNMQDSAKLGEFLNEFQDDIDNMWKNSGSTPRTYSLPGKIEQVCLNDDSEIYFLPRGSANKFDYTNIEHLDIEEILNGREKRCFEVVDGKFKITIKMDFGEDSVLLE